MKEIQIRRRETKSHLPPPVVSNARKILSSIYSGQGPLRGLSKDEEKTILSKYLGVGPDEQNFGTVCREFWADLRVEIPSEGKVLNITTIDGEPVQPYDYIIYKWALKHKYVAKDRPELLQDSSKQFYIHDPDVEIRYQNKKVSFKKKAYEVFIKVSEDEEEVNRLITVLTESDPEQMSLIQKQNYIDQLIEEDPEKFVSVATDKNLAIKAEISEMVSLNILKKMANQYWFIDHKLGDTLDETVLFFKDKKKSETVNLIRAKLQEAKK